MKTTQQVNFPVNLWKAESMADLPWLPLSLVLWVVNHGRLPLSVHLIVPVLGLCGVGVGDVLGLVPVLGLINMIIEPS